MYASLSVSVTSSAASKNAMNTRARAFSEAWKGQSESDIVAELFKMYRKLTENQA